MYTAPENKKSKLFKAYATRTLGHLAHTTTAKNMYHTTAFVLKEKIKINSSIIATNYDNQVEVILIG